MQIATLSVAAAIALMLVSVPAFALTSEAVEPLSSAAQEPLASYPDGGPTGEADDPYSAYDLCVDACSFVGVLSCSEAVALCLAGEELTVGGATIPAAMLIAVSCVAIPGGGAACLEKLCR